MKSSCFPAHDIGLHRAPRTALAGQAVLAFVPVDAVTGAASAARHTASVWYVQVFPAFRA